MTPYIYSAIVSEDGLVLSHLPFKKGDRVKVIVVPDIETQEENTTQLIGSVLKYENPYEPPISEELWDMYS